MFPSVNIHSSVPVYQQIENHVQFGIASGRLKPGDQLPPMIELAKQIDVNVNTVNKAYRELELMGYLYTRKGMGCYICDGVAAKCREACRQRIAARLHEVVQEAKAAGIDLKSIMETVKESYAVDGSPYEDAPQKILKTGKGSKK